MTTLTKLTEAAPPVSLSQATQQANTCGSDVIVLHEAGRNEDVDALLPCLDPKLLPAQLAASQR
jgi:hypothetical protein